MYKIQKIFTDINETSYNVSSLKYGNIVYIFINNGNDFDGLVKIIMEEVIEVNSSGIIVRGYQIYFDEEENEERKYYTGIFVYKSEDNFIKTSEGYKTPVFINNKLELMPYEYIIGKKILEWEFKIDKFTIILNISGNLYFNNEEIRNYIKNIEFESCIAYKNKVILSINGIKIIFKDINVRYNNRQITYDDFFDYASSNLESLNKAVYPINRIFNLKPAEFIISGY